MKRLLLLPVLVACAPTPPADPEFDDAAQFIYREYETASEAELAFAVRALETELFTSMDLTSSQVADRALQPASLTEEDVSMVPHPDVDLGEALPVAVARASEFSVDDHWPLLLMADQTPLEPQSPDLYDRTFLDGTDDCWPDRDCPILETSNWLTKTNFLLTATYDLDKQFQWIDLNLPDPSELEEGEEPTHDDPRWAVVARSWMPESALSEDESTVIDQSFAIELYLPYDGDLEGDDDWQMVRMMCLWAQTTFTFEVDDDLVITTTRAGIDDIYKHYDDYLADPE